MVMAAVLRRPRALDQLDAMVEASRSTRIAQAPTRLAAVASRHTKASLMARSGPPGGHAEPAW
jgi:hypothetical protein